MRGRATSPQKTTSVLAVVVRHVGRSCTPWALRAGEARTPAAGVAFQHSSSGSPIPVSLERTHRIPGAQTATCRRPSFPTATVCVPGMWFGIGRLTGMGEPYEHCVFALVLVFDFPPHPLISARPARTILILTLVLDQDQKRKDGLAGRADHRRGVHRSNPGMSRLRGGVCAAGAGSSVAPRARVFSARPSASQPHPEERPPSRWEARAAVCVAGATPRGAVSKLQAVRRTHENPRRGGFTPPPRHRARTPEDRPPPPPPDNPGPSAAAPQQPTTRPTTANTPYKNGQHGVQERPTRAEARNPAHPLRRVGRCRTQCWPKWYATLAEVVPHPPHPHPLP
ncbi:hypothetical protein HNR67_007338 [Crossiella cryophila]|uniref:Uncharacterized protein n=1 Tax=Crossiella cryophila TaxID=43355 RepID=A0A7W7CH92_9PSEU|nr:hypothetical protein [Crossiella cryophila]